VVVRRDEFNMLAVSVSVVKICGYDLFIFPFIRFYLFIKVS